MKKILAFLLLSSAFSAHANEPFVGAYNKNDVDSVSQLMLLEKQRFCFSLSAGSLDLLTGGSWQKVSERNGKIHLQLQEKWLDLPDVFMVVNPQLDKETLADAQEKFGKQQRVLAFMTPMAEDALGTGNPDFAFSSHANIPAKTAFKPAFAANAERELYRDVFIPQNTRYVFVRSARNGQIFRFAVGKAQYMGLNPNEQAGRERLTWHLLFDSKTHELLVEQEGETEKLGQPEKLSPQAQNNAWAKCEPKTLPNAKKTVQGKQWTILLPDVFASRK